jgi:hypothetical protein
MEVVRGARDGVRSLGLSPSFQSLERLRCVTLAPPASSLPARQPTCPLARQPAPLMVICPVTAIAIRPMSLRR